MRYEGVAKGGFYPTPESQTQKIINRLKFTGPTRLFDPCVGEGVALSQVASTAPTGSVSYGIELDRERAKKAGVLLHHVIPGGYEYARLPNEAFPLLFLNPPYDAQAGLGSDTMRKEYRFMRDLAKYVIPGGVMVLIIPRYTLTKVMVSALQNRYSDLAVYQFDESEYEVFKQVVVFGVRRMKNLETLKQLTDDEIDQRNELMAAGQELDIPLPTLDEPDGKVWTVPTVNMQVEIEFRGGIRDESELIKDLAESDAFMVAENMLNATLAETKLRRPLLPFRRTHLATLIASGALNGAIGIGENRHMVIGVSRKKVTRETVTDDEGVTKVIDTESYITMVRTIQPDGTIIDLQ